MHTFSQLLQTDHVLALLIALLIFLMTLFLAVKRWIGFSITLLLLLFSLAAGVLINNQHAFQGYLGHYSPSTLALPLAEGNSDAFQKHILKAVEDLQTEMQTEKENLLQLKQQVQDLFVSMDTQKQKLQNFIEETRERFKTEYPTQDQSTTDTQH